MRYRFKLFITILLALTTLNTALFYSLHNHTDGLMLMLERDQYSHAMQRLLNALDRETDNLDLLNLDWAAWDDTYEFIVDRNSDYIESNLVDSSFTSNNLDLIVFLDTAGQPVYRQGYDRENEEAMEIPESFFSALSETPQIWNFQHPEDYRKGFLQLPEGLLLLSVRPILTSNEEGPVRGALFMGRFFTQQEQEEIQKLTQQGFSIFMAPAKAANTGGIKAQLDDEGLLSVTAPINDLLGTPTWLIESRFPRNFYYTGLKNLKRFMFWNLLTSSILALIVWLIADKLIITRNRVIQSEKSHRELSLELQTILNGITSPIFLVSQQHRVLWANQASKAIFKQLDEAASGKTKLDIPFISLSTKERCPVIEALATGKQRGTMIQLDDKRIMTQDVFPLLSDTQEISGVICMLTDITEQIRLKDEAEQRNRLTSLGELAAGIAHDINNPLGMLQLNLPMLKDVFQGFVKAIENKPNMSKTEFGGLDFSYIQNKLPYLLDEMILNSQKINKMSDDLKNFSRQQPSSATTFKLDRVVHSALLLINYKLVTSTQNFTCTMEKDLPELLGQPHQIEQVLINLLLNACQALNSEQQAITLTTSYDRQNRQVVIEVIDEGMGIDQDQLKKITKPFFTTKDQQGGTGLGLSMAERIIKQHKGALQFSSTPGVGTCARIVLPVNEES